MKNVKYVVIHFICFLMISRSVVVFGSQKHSARRPARQEVLDTDEDRAMRAACQEALNSDEVRQIISRIPRLDASCVAARLFAQNLADSLAQARRVENLEPSSTRVTSVNQLSQQGRATCSLELQVRRSEHRQSAALAERISILGVPFSDQVGGVPLSEQQKARRETERLTMETSSQWAE
jgi:uncharacterized protein YjhX (UPF0386 family)